MIPDPAPLTVWLPSIRAGSGSDVFMQRLAEGLAAQGHHPRLQWFPHHYELTPWRLAGVAAPAGTDVVHCGSWQGFALHRPGLPLVITEHNFVGDPAFAPYRSLAQSLYHRCLVRSWVRRSYQAADAVVAVSAYTASTLAASTRAAPEVIHNWVDSERFAPLPMPATRGERPFRLLFVGNPSRWKGSDLLPGIAQALGPDFELLCLGGLRKGMTAPAVANLRMLPPVAPADMPAVYHLADAVLVPARYEAFGYVALEAMACGLPVVGFDSTGTREVCRQGETALLVPLEDVAAMVAQCRRLAADPELCRRLGKAGRQRALEAFSVERGVAAYVDLYRRVIAARQSR